MIDNAPDVPSVIVNGFYSNLYNSTLSAAAPIRAAIGNLGGLVEKPIGNFVGALVTGDSVSLGVACSNTSLTSKVCKTLLVT